MLDFMIEKISVWDALRTAQKPIVLYGMGNGADKILANSYGGSSFAASL